MYVSGSRLHLGCCTLYVIAVLLTCQLVIVVQHGLACNTSGVLLLLCCWVAHVE
jgi:hypothetical protein